MPPCVSLSHSNALSTLVSTAASLSRAGSSKRAHSTLSAVSSSPGSRARAPSSAVEVCCSDHVFRFQEGDRMDTSADSAALSDDSSTTQADMIVQHAYWTFEASVHDHDLSYLGQMLFWVRPTHLIKSLTELTTERRRPCHPLTTIIPWADWAMGAPSPTHYQSQGLAASNTVPCLKR